MARVQDVVELGKLLPENATRDELRAYNKLASDITKKTRQQRLELEEQGKTATDPRTNRKPPPRSDSSDYDSPVRARPRFSNMRRTDRKKVARKLDDDFKLEEDGDKEEQLTPAEALITAQEYLSRAQKGKKGGLDRNTTMALKIMKDAITVSAPKKASARRVPREKTPDMDPSSPDDEDGSDDWRK